MSTQPHGNSGSYYSVHSRHGVIVVTLYSRDVSARVVRERRYVAHSSVARISAIRFRRLEGGASTQVNAGARLRIEHPADPGHRCPRVRAEEFRVSCATCGMRSTAAGCPAAGDAPPPQFKASQLRVPVSWAWNCRLPCSRMDPDEFLDFYQQHNGNIVSKLAGVAFHTNPGNTFVRYTRSSPSATSLMRRPFSTAR